MAALAPQAAEDHFPVSAPGASALSERVAFWWTFLWTADGRVAFSGDPFTATAPRASWSWPFFVGLCIQSYLGTAALSYRTKADRLIGGSHPTQGTPPLPPTKILKLPLEEV